MIKYNLNTQKIKVIKTKTQNEYKDGQLNIVEFWLNDKKVNYDYLNSVILENWITYKKQFLESFKEDVKIVIEELNNNVKKESWYFNQIKKALIKESD